jgi:uncharacterized protein YxjI
MDAYFKFKMYTEYIIPIVLLVILFVIAVICIAIGSVKEKIFTWLPKFEIYRGSKYLGSINKEFSFFRPRFNIDYNGWHIDGDLFEWDYTILNGMCQKIATVSKQLFNWTDTYVIDVNNENDALYVLMLVIAIDAEKCSRRD